MFQFSFFLGLGYYGQSNEQFVLHQTSKNNINNTTNMIFTCHKVLRIYYISYKINNNMKMFQYYEAPSTLYSHHHHPNIAC